MRKLLWLTNSALLFGMAFSVRAETVEVPFEYSLSQLMNLAVTAPAKKEQSILKTPSAITVITSEDIERSGIHRLQELFRMVPGMNVAMINNNNWAISVRGFNRLYSKKLLVMIDGRTIYSPVSAGVVWAAQNVMLKDIDRIEVIRGPGASVWGSNAVNGVINIVTKAAEDTQGSYASALIGTEETVDVNLRHGGKVGNDAFYRVYLKASQFDEQKHGIPKHTCPEPPVVNAGDPAKDDWSTLQGGFRLDVSMGSSDSFRLQGDVYDNDTRQSFFFPILEDACTRTVIDENHDFLGSNLLGEWRHRYENKAETTYSFYLDHAKRTDILFTETLDTAHVEVNHRFYPSARQDVIIGGSYRIRSSKTRGTFPFSMNPEDRDDFIASLFIQDDIRLTDHFSLILGSKLERNDYTGNEFQPTLRALWAPRENMTVWGAVSQASRIPSRTEVDGVINIFAFKDNTGTTNVGTILGNKNFSYEKLTAYELGFRSLYAERWLLDITAFYFDYTDNADATNLPAVTKTQPITYIQKGQISTNTVDLATYGIETAMTYQPSERLKVKVCYSLLQQVNDNNPISINEAEKTPQEQWTVQVFNDLNESLRWDSSLYYVGELKGFNIPAYTRVDTQFSWQVSERTQWFAGVHNLMDNTHAEFSPSSFSSASEIERNWFIKAAYQFQ